MMALVVRTEEMKCALSGNRGSIKITHLPSVTSNTTQHAFHFLYLRPISERGNKNPGWFDKSIRRKVFANRCCDATKPLSHGFT